MATTEELRELGATLRRALGTTAPDAAPVVDPDWRDTWPAIAEIGVLTFCVPEALGGFGLDATAALVAARELGAALDAGPYAAATAAVFALSRGLADTVLIDAITAGRHVVTLALRPERVLGADDADGFVVAGPDDTLRYVTRDHVQVTARHPFDTTRSCASIAIDAAAGTPLQLAAADRARLDLLYGLLLAGDSLGGCERSLTRTVAYAGQRIAFGRPIGGFQAVQHRLVDHTLQVGGMARLAEAAAAALTHDAPDAPRRCIVAEAAAAEAVHVLHDLLHLTGGIGFTWDYGLHHHERRAHLNAQLRGLPRAAVPRLAALEGWSTP